MEPLGDAHKRPVNSLGCFETRSLMDLEHTQLLKGQILLCNTTGTATADGHTWNSYSKLNTLQMGGKRIFPLQ